MRQTLVFNQKSTMRENCYSNFLTVLCSYPKKHLVQKEDGKVSYNSMTFGGFRDLS